MDHANRLECQDCGNTIMYLTAMQQQAVADRPYDFILFCTECRRLKKRSGFE